MNAEWLGRLHPLLVHFPIGFLFLGFILEFLSIFKRFRKVKGAVPTTIFLGTVGAILTALTGWLLSDEGGYEPDLLFRHRLFGIMTATVSIMLLVMVNYGKNLPKPKRRPARLAVFAVLVILIMITGHFGGSITHGRGYLSINPNDTQVSSPSLFNQPTAEMAPAQILVYQDIINPILMTKCAGCHGEKKQKGKLRLDSEVAIRTGGKQGHILMVNGKRSELIHRIQLSIDDEDHMPPREKEQLTNLEIELLSDWIKGGAPFDENAAQFETPSIKRFLENYSVEKETSWWPEDLVAPASQSDLNALKMLGVKVYPISNGLNYLEMDIPENLNLDNAFWKSFNQVAPLLVSINLSGHYLTAQDLKKMTAAQQIRKLYLVQSRIESGSLTNLQLFKNLFYLNLVGAGVKTNDLLLLSGHPSLKEVYLFGNEIDEQQVAVLRKKNPSIKFNTKAQQLQVLPSDTIFYTP